MCKLSRSLAVDEIASAKAIVSGRGVDGALTFELLVNKNDSKLYGTLKLPADIATCEVVIRIYDSNERKIGEGGHTLTKSHFDAGRCVTAEIGIESAKPRIDTIYAKQGSVGLHDSVTLHSTARDSFGGTIEKYEWMFGDGLWIETSSSDTTVVAPAMARAWVCSLRVSDDDGNSTYAATTINVETRMPVAVTGPDTAVGINDAINLRGNASHDETEIVHYAWKTGDGEWNTVSTGDTTANAPATAQTWVCSLRVTDDDGNTAYDAVAVVAETRAPLADGGSDTTVGINDKVKLQGSRSSDETQIVEYAWKCGSGSWHADADGDTTVTAPSTAQTWTCSLRVRDDDGNISYDAVTVTIETRAPNAVAEADSTVGTSDEVSLTGSGSSEETEIVEYAWKCGDGGWRTDADGDTMVIAPSKAQFWLCSLKVTDDDGNTAYDAIEIVVGGPTITDGDGNTYSIVVIGNQVWTVENLRTTKYNDGTDIPQVTGYSEWVNLKTPGYSFYDNSTDAAYQKKWGALYNWYAVNTGKLAPEGWRVPTDTDWTVLENYLIANGYNWDGSTTSNKVGKALAAKTDWLSSSISGAVGNDLSSNNRSGFSALPSGGRDSKGYFYNRTNNVFWWSATELDASSAHNRVLYYYMEDLIRGKVDKWFGFSVRLVRDLN